MNKFLKEFKDRGFFYQCTNENELSALLDKKRTHNPLIKVKDAILIRSDSLNKVQMLNKMSLEIDKKFKTNF